MAKNKGISKYNPKGLKLKDVIYLLDPIMDVAIWTQEDDKEPSWYGSFLDIPWFYLDYELGSLDEKDDEPISFREDLGEDLHHRSGVVIQLIAK